MPTSNRTGRSVPTGRARPPRTGSTTIARTTNSSDPMVIEPVTTARLALRPITTADVDRIVELDSDPAVMRYINGGPATPRDEAARIVERSLGHRWLAFERDGDA